MRASPPRQPEGRMVQGCGCRTSLQDRHPEMIRCKQTGRKTPIFQLAMRAIVTLGTNDISELLAAPRSHLHRASVCSGAVAIRDYS